MSGKVTHFVFLTSLANDMLRINNPITPPRSYHNAGRPSAKILPPATMVADPPIVVAVNVAVRGNVFRLLLAKKKLVGVVIFFFAYTPIKVITAI